MVPHVQTQGSNMNSLVDAARVELYSDAVRSLVPACVGVLTYVSYSRDVCVCVLAELLIGHHDGCVRRWQVHGAHVSACVQHAEPRVPGSGSLQPL